VKFISYLLTNQFERHSKQSLIDIKIIKMISRSADVSQLSDRENTKNIGLKHEIQSLKIWVDLYAEHEN